VRGEHTCEITVDRRIQCVQLSIGDPSLRLDGSTRVIVHDGICLGASVQKAELVSIAEPGLSRLNGLRKLPAKTHLV
jgi:hypothetical protein